MKEWYKEWYLNALVAVIAAVLSITQEILILTEPDFLSFFALGFAASAVMSLCTEMVKSVIWDHRWCNSNITYGAIAGTIASFIAALAVC
jgi:hypothetical protein